MGHLFGGTVASAIVGGLGSVAGGGEFTNGAATAAFGYLFNEVLHISAGIKVPSWAQKWLCGNLPACGSGDVSWGVAVQYPGAFDQAPVEWGLGTTSSYSIDGTIEPPRDSFPQGGGFLDRLYRALKSLPFVTISKNVADFDLSSGWAKTSGVAVGPGAQGTRSKVPILAVKRESVHLGWASTTATHIHVSVHPVDRMVAEG
jgi:hypothetical protein